MGAVATQLGPPGRWLTDLQNGLADVIHPVGTGTDSASIPTEKLCEIDKSICMTRSLCGKTRLVNSPNCLCTK